MKGLHPLAMAGLLALLGCSQIEIIGVEHDANTQRFNVEVKNLEANDTSARIYISGHTIGVNVPVSIAIESERFEIEGAATKVVPTSSAGSGFFRVPDWDLCIDAGVHSAAKTCQFQGGITTGVLPCSPLQDAGESCP